MEMYDRQKNITMTTDIKVAVVGCGGVGYWTAKFLAMSGVETFHLFDPDTLEIHNLNRLDLPIDVLGRNKADITKLAIKQIRENAEVTALPFPFKGEFLREKVNIIVDCTDKIAAQKIIYDHAKKSLTKYMKVGYDGTHVTIANKPATWGDETPGGYTITPSWVVPAVLVASMATGAILKYFDKELSLDISNLYRLG
jgi:tRNA A37 threonylcarbamoyladenosine dehydratase